MDKDINKISESIANKDTIMAFVDAIIPRTPILAQIYGDIMFYGALDQEVDVYLVMNIVFDSKGVSFVQVITEMLNQASKQYMVEEGTEKIYHYYRVNHMRRQREPIAFSELPRRERLRALSLLEQSEYSFSMKEKIQEHPRSQSITSFLVQFTMLGYYSEWYGYGRTRLLKPSQRVFETAPISWQQTSYPGPSFSRIEQVREYNAIKESRNLRAQEEV